MLAEMGAAALADQMVPAVTGPMLAIPAANRVVLGAAVTAQPQVTQETLLQPPLVARAVREVMAI